MDALSSPVGAASGQNCGGRGLVVELRAAAGGEQLGVGAALRDPPVLR